MSQWLRFVDFFVGEKGFGFKIEMLYFYVFLG